MKQKQKKQYRNEWKYQCSEMTLSSVMERIGAVMQTDENGLEGAYTIRSLYFDDIYNSCTRENEAGVDDRYKYRIRYYGDNTDFIRLEKKEKKNGRCHKDSCRITIDEYNSIVNGDYSNVFWNTESFVLREFCMNGMVRGLCPKVIVEYDRQALVEPISNVRITADRCISASYQIESFLEGEYTKFPVLPRNQHVLEVKFDSILPSHIRRVVSDDGLIQSSFSKYYMARQELSKLERLY